MFSQYISYAASNTEAGKILNNSLPEHIFDAHAHLFDTAQLPNLAARFPGVVCDWDKAALCPGTT